ncbi:MAG: cytochrome c biogenesis protein [Bdellovibrionales bacterium]
MIFAQIVAGFLSLALAQMPADHPTVSMSPEQALSALTTQGLKIGTDEIRRVAVTQNGRVKPLDSLARETILFLIGSYGRWGMSPVQLYLALPTTEGAELAPIVEIRDVKLRTRLGYLRDKRFFSYNELAASELGNLAQPLLQKQEEGGKLKSTEKAVTEAFSQMALLQQLMNGNHFLQSVDFSFLNNNHGQASGSQVAPVAGEYLAMIKQNPVQAGLLAQELVRLSREQETPDLFKHYLQKLDAEIFYNNLRPFLIAALLSILFGLLFVVDVTRKKISKPLATGLYLAAVLPLMVGIGFRVYITQFAPVTNMYTTMLWVALGVVVFGLALFYLYENYAVSGFLLISSGLILMLTEKIPLILSPDMDPIVAVLRSNFWLSTHVTTITISYAAFTIAMILGNVALFKIWRTGDHSAFIKEYSHYAYRMIQLGCFLLSVGIILGGVWADYSWGRFWGWDPKETWALIADMGFLALLHARFVGWVKPFTLLALSPVAYLLVIMAWYGVNFILAAGLHSYGFSSGGAAMVGIYVTVQVAFISASLYKARHLWKSVPATGT